MTPRRIVDSHVHLWDTRRFRYPWLADTPSLNRPFLLHDYAGATRGFEVEHIVFLQCEAEPSRALDEAQWVSSLASEEPRIGAIIPFAPIELGNGCHAVLQELSKLPLVRGVRRIIQYERDQAFCLTPGVLEGLNLLPGFGFSFDICISHVQLEPAIEMVTRCPAVSFVLDHIAKPDIKSGSTEPWATHIGRLAELPNVTCKISGMVTEADHARWREEQLAPYIDRVIDRFGIERVMFGGDWPVVTLASPWVGWLDALAHAAGSLRPEERDLLFAGNARRIYRIQS
jgi:L-fuconolactonase